MEVRLPFRVMRFCIVSSLLKSVAVAFLLHALAVCGQELPAIDAKARAVSELIRLTPTARDLRAHTIALEKALDEWSADLQSRGLPAKDGAEFLNELSYFLALHSAEGVAALQTSNYHTKLLICGISEAQRRHLQYFVAVSKFPGLVDLRLFQAINRLNKMEGKPVSVDELRALIFPHRVEIRSALRSGREDIFADASPATKNWILLFLGNQGEVQTAKILHQEASGRSTPVSPIK